MGTHPLALASARLVLLLLAAGLLGGAVAGGGRQLKALPFCSKIDLSFDHPMRGTPPAPLAMQDNRVVNADTGKQVLIRGLNWCVLQGCSRC